MQTEVPSVFSVFGSHGFVGNGICKDGDFLHNEPDSHNYKDKFQSDYPDILYLISTTDNYNVKKNNPYVDISTNLTHLMTVLQANRMKYGNDFTITFVSSWFVYGDTECPAREESNCNPRGFYSITKRTAEQLLISYCETFGIKWRILRLSNVMGVDDHKISAEKNALQYMIRELCMENEINLYDEDCSRDYLHVEDVVDAIRFLCRRGNFGEIYNVGSGIDTSIHRLVNLAHRLTEYKGKINLVPVPEFHKAVQVKNMWLDTTKITELGWIPRYGVEELVEELCNFYKEINAKSRNPV